MGMIKINSPYDKINDSQQMIRLSKIPTKSEMANVSHKEMSFTHEQKG